MSRVQFYGVTRFSTYSPGSGAWLASQGAASEAEYRAHLFSDERMGPRCEIFCTLALPIYQQMADRHAYRHIVHFSEALPGKWRDRLYEAAYDYPVLLLDKVDGPQMHSQVTMRRDIEARNPDVETVAWFRVDDDDLLSVDYLDRLNTYATPQHHGFAVSFGLGVAALYGEGGFSDFREVHARLPSQGQAYIGRNDRLAGRLVFPKATTHTRQDTSSPVIYDSRDVAYVYTFHDGQDRGVGAASAADRLERYEPFKNMRALRSRFPTIAAHLPN